MSLTKIGSIGINTGIQLAGVTTVATLHVGSGVTLSSDGDGFFTGIITATFAGDGTNLTGVASTDNIRTNTNATFLQNINVSGTVTATSYAGDGSALTGIDATQIVTGNTSVQTVDTGSDGHVKVNTEGSERFRIDSSGNVNLGAAAANTGIDTATACPFSGATPKLEIKLGGASNSYTRLINIANPSGATGSETLGRVGIKLALGNESNATETVKAGIIYAESTSAFNNGTSLCFATNNSERLRITSAGNVGINSAVPEAQLMVLQTDTVANSLTFKTAAGQIFRNEDAEFAFGLSNADPYPLFIQGRYKTNTARDITINALGGNVIVGAAVTISESGIEASGIGVTIANLNGGQTSMNRNMVKNGAMVIAQRGTGALTVSNSGQNYQVDTWRGRANGGGQFSMQQITDDAPAGTGLYYSTKLQVTAADTSLAATDYYEFIHYIEGYDFQRTAFGTSGAKDLTLSFYVKCNATGVFTGSLVNSGNNRSFAFTYPITQALTWSRVVIKVPGDTSGTWNKDNGVGIKIVLALKIGSNFVTANPNTWAGSELMGATAGNYNLMNSTSNYIYFTGIQLEEGTEATPFEHVHYSEALRQCQRYFWKNADNTYRRVNGYKRHDSNVHFELQAPVPMRVAPSPNLTDGGIFTNFQSNFGSSQSSPSITEWDVSIGKGLLVISSDYSSTHVNVPSWEGYQLELSAEF